MRRFALIGALSAGLALAGTASGGGCTPKLKLLSADPLTVRGSGFHRYERVRVTVVTSRTFARTVRTTAGGAFTAAFDSGSFAFDRCGSSLVVTARGARSASATLKVIQPDCPPSLGP